MTKLLQENGYKVVRTVGEDTIFRKETDNEDDEDKEDED